MLIGCWKTCEAKVSASYLSDLRSSSSVALGSPQMEGSMLCVPGAISILLGSRIKRHHFPLLALEFIWSTKMKRS